MRYTVIFRSDADINEKETNINKTGTIINKIYAALNKSDLAKIHGYPQEYFLSEMIICKQ